ncbi:hypothetical protein [Candidatus Thioglobus sp.]|uniref:hypothetical protein n=1 Tax=Candidatus Thioglobus sp. TaxID=2026721 RepID=UPI003D133E4D
MKKIILLISLLITTQVFADAYIAVNKGDASLCEVIPAQAKKGHHYNKSVNPREISSDLWRSGKNGLGFFKLGKSEIQSQTVQLAFVDKYSTFWYYTKQNTKTKGPYFYDFIAPNNSGKKFVDIDLQLPCSCFLDVDKPQRCSSQLNRFQDKFGNWWQQTGSSTAKKIGNNISDKSNQAVDATKDWWNTTGSKQAAEVGSNISDKSNQAVDATKDWWNTTGSKQAAEVGDKIGEGSHKTWDATKRGWSNIKEGWKNYQDQ